MKILRCGEDGIRIILGEAVDPEVNLKVRQCDSFLRTLGLKEIVDVIPSFKSCLIHYDPDRISFQDIQAMILERQGEIDRVEVLASRAWEIPVHYGSAEGPDMDFVCSYSGLTREEVIEIHTSAVYTVFAVGFMPGFPYLGILDKRLYVPRLDTPRIKVPEGSVGLAQLQTGIYPFESPAGWRIIGKTELRLFDSKKEPYSLLRIGDTVKLAAL
ncbi:MAG TPA: 5-oxoprolinase subunit PxpB [Syntrophorhabdaceae bacterium]|jgi:KipI family sensor histidine kinase inhibitor